MENLGICLSQGNVSHTSKSTPADAAAERNAWDHYSVKAAFTQCVVLRPAASPENFLEMHIPRSPKQIC